MLPLFGQVLIDVLIESIIIWPKDILGNMKIKTILHEILNNQEKKCYKSLTSICLASRSSVKYQNYRNFIFNRNLNCLKKIRTNSTNKHPWFDSLWTDSSSLTLNIFFVQKLRHFIPQVIQGKGLTLKIFHIIWLKRVMKSCA